MVKIKGTQIVSGCFFFFLILNLRRLHREAKISIVTLGTIIQPFNNLTFETSGKGDFC